MPLPTQEILLLRGMRKTAVALILLLRINKPVRATEVARLLDINYETARIYLRQLVETGLVQRMKAGFFLTPAGLEMFQPVPGKRCFGEGENADSAPLINPINTESININHRDKDLRNSSNKQRTADAEIWEAFKRCGISANPRTERLAGQEHITPEYIEGHAKNMKRGGKKFPKWSGLLITILEKGELLPHNGYCACEECMDRMRRGC